MSIIIERCVTATSPRFFTITGDSPIAERKAANAAAEGGDVLHGAELRPVCVQTTSAVGGGLNFNVTTHVYASIFRNLGNAQEAWQTYLRSRSVEHIFVVTWRVDTIWSPALSDSFRPVTGHAEWCVEGSVEDDAPPYVPPESTEEEADAATADYGEDAPQRVDDVPEDEPPELHLAFAAADKQIALDRGKPVAAALTRYHKMTRLIDLLGTQCPPELTQDLLDKSVRSIYTLPAYTGGRARTMQPKTFKHNGFVVRIVPQPPRRIWTAEDQHDLYQTAWASRAAFDTGRHDSEVTHALYVKAAGGAKRIKLGRASQLHAHTRRIASQADGARPMCTDADDAEAVRKLVMSLQARRRNAPSAFFEQHDAIARYMGFEVLEVGGPRPKLPCS